MNETPRGRRRQWPQVMDRGVIVVRDPAATPDVRIAESNLLPRVVFRGGIEISTQRDFLVVGPGGDRADYLTVTFRPQLQITTGCASVDLEQFEAEVEAYKRGEELAYYRAAVRFIRAVAEVRSGVPVDTVEGCG